MVRSGPQWCEGEGGGGMMGGQVQEALLGTCRGLAAGYRQWLFGRAWAGWAERAYRSKVLLGAAAEAASFRARGRRGAGGLRGPG